MPQTERMTWPDGNWWEFRTFLPISLEREWMPLAFEALKADSAGKPTVDLQDPETVKKIQHLNDILLLKSTISWSYGGITQEILELVPGYQYDEAMNRMLELYRPLVERSIKTLLGGSMQQSADILNSRPSTNSPTTSMKPDGPQTLSNEPIEALFSGT